MLDEKMVESTDIFGTSFAYTTEFNNEEKLKRLELTAQLKLSAMLDLIQLEGSGKFLKLEKRSSRVAMAALFQTITTKYEEISITNVKFQDLVDFDLLDKINATHVVIAIQWGGKMIVTVQDTNINYEDTLEIEGRLGVNLQAWFAQISGDASIQFTDKEKNEMKSYKFFMNGDVLPDSTPTTLIEAFALMDNISYSLKKGNSGKGKPIQFKLTPLSLLKTLWSKNQKANILINRIEDEIIDECIQLLDKMDVLKQNINDLKTDLNKYDKFIPKTIVNISVLPKKFPNVITKAKTDLSKILVQIRSGTMKSTDLQPQYELITKNIIIPTENTIERVSKIIKVHMDFVEFLKEKNITVFNKDDIIERFLHQNSKKDIFFLLFAEEYTRDRKDKLKTFLDMKDDEQYYSKALFVAVKLGIINEMDSHEDFGNVSVIYHYKGIEIVNRDYGHGQYVTGYKELWSPRRIQDTMETTLNKIEGRICLNLFILFIQFIHIY